MWAVLPTPSRDTLLHGAAVLLVDEEIFRRRKGLRPEQLPDLRYSVVRQWVRASGASREQDLDAVERMIADDLNRRLGSMPAGYAKLDPSCLQRAQHLAAMAGRPGDTRLVFSIFRCLQRCAAIAVDGRVQWRAEWLRGPKGRTGMRFRARARCRMCWARCSAPRLRAGEGGTAGLREPLPRTVLPEPIPLGGMDHSEAVRALGLRNSTPRGFRSGADEGLRGGSWKWRGAGPEGEIENEDRSYSDPVPFQVVVRSKSVII